MTESQLTQLITHAASQEFAHAQAALGRDEILGYAIMSHDTANSCGAVVATRTGIEAFQHGSRADFIYSPENWDYVTTGSLFEPVNEAIHKLYEAGDYELDPGWHIRFRQLVFGSSVMALESLVGSDFFGSSKVREQAFVVLCISDSREMEKTAPAWVERLNSPSVVRDYRAWHAQTYGRT